jgi:halogenation protein CepH
MKGAFKKASTLNDEDVPIVNGKLEATWRINGKSHTLEPIRGVTFDPERPVFSSTTSWLLGRNVAPLDESACSLLELMDGGASWSSIVSKYSEKASLSREQGRKETSEIVAPLLLQGYVLVRSEATVSSEPTRMG